MVMLAFLFLLIDLRAARKDLRRYKKRTQDLTGQLEAARDANAQVRLEASARPREQSNYSPGYGSTFQSPVSNPQSAPTSEERPFYSPYLKQLPETPPVPTAFPPPEAERHGDAFDSMTDVDLVPPRVFTQATARELLLDWCRKGAAGVPVAPMERTAVRLGNASQIDSDGVAAVFEDVRQVTEFLRVGISGGDEAWLIPNPDARFTPYVGKIFPGLTENWEQNSQQYDKVIPVKLTRNVDATWCASTPY